MGDGGVTKTLAFLFTDIEGSTRLWEQHADAMRSALAQHDDLLRAGVEAQGGTVVKTTGDGVLAVFEEPAIAVTAAIGVQHELGSAAWGDTGALRVRMAVHCGPAIEREGDYFGTTLNRTARLMALAHGGQIVASETVALLVREVTLEGGATLRDLGEHRLRDLSHVERVYQVDVPGLAIEFAPLRSLDAYSSNLPSQLTSFVGREDDVEVLTALLRGSRLVTLTGVGGVGKTRLALRVAAEVLPEAPDGVWLCELAAADAEEAALEIVSRALGVVPRPGMSALESILDHLRGRACLIVLDNCEHLLDIVAGLTDAILRGCENVRVLATSREGLGIEGEQLRPIRSLPVPEGTTAAAALSSDATALFAERATAVAPAFRIDDTNSPAVVEICRRLDGIPLAIELASARVASMQPAEIAALLDERFRLLTGSRRRSVERHQTLRATVDWSYSLLGDLERTVYDRLGAFVGSFDGPAAQSVVADSAIGAFEVLDALGELVAKSMLAAEPTAEGTTRYQLLETLRQYALERLEETGEVDRYRRHHAAHYVTVAAELGRVVYGPDEVQARARLEREIDNLRAAVDWAIDAGDPELVCGLIIPLARESAWSRGSEVGSWAERALALIDDHPTRWQHLRLAAGNKAFFADANMAEALRMADAMLADPDLPVHPRLDALILRSISLGQLDDMAGCIETLEEACARITTDADVDPRDPTAITAGCNLSIYLALSGEVERAVTVAEDSLRRAQSFGGPSTLALAHFALGYVHLDRDLGIAAAHSEEALRFSDLGAGNIVRDRALQQLALIAWRDEDTTAAAAHLTRGLLQSFAIGDYSACAYMVEHAVSVLAARARWDAALALDQALTDGILPPVGLSRVAEARERAVAASRAALRGTCPPQRRGPRSGCDRSAGDRRAPNDRGDLTRRSGSTRRATAPKPVLFARPPPRRCCPSPARANASAKPSPAVVDPRLLPVAVEKVSNLLRSKPEEEEGIQLLVVRDDRWSTLDARHPFPHEGSAALHGRGSVGHLVVERERDRAGDQRQGSSEGSEPPRIGRHRDPRRRPDRPAGDDRQQHEAEGNVLVPEVDLSGLQDPLTDGRHAPREGETHRPGPERGRPREEAGGLSSASSDPPPADREVSEGQCHGEDGALETEVIEGRPRDVAGVTEGVDGGRRSPEPGLVPPSFEQPPQRPQRARDGDRQPAARVWTGQGVVHHARHRDRHSSRGSRQRERQR